MLYFDEFLETDAKKKTAEWGNKMISHFRMYWKPLVNPTVSQQNMDIILSRYNLENVMKMFKEPKKLGMEFMAIAIMEKVRNILVGEATKAGLGANINAIDPVAEDQKKKDRKLLDNKKDIEDVISFMQQSIGLPEYKMQNEKENGNKPYSGNLEMFEELGLDSEDNGDKGYFMKAWHRLQHEMDAQEIVNAYFKVNEVEENIESYINDILANRTIADQVYVNEMNGAIDIEYTPPEEVYLIPGNRKDGKDSVCLGRLRVSTIGDVIQRMGNNFSLKEEWMYLVNAVNYHNNTKYEGIWDGKNAIYGQSQNSKNLIHINDFMSFKVQLGYIEWKSYDQTVYKVGVDYHGNLRSYMRDPTYTPDAESGYSKQSWYNENTYKSFFLSTSSNSQREYKYGKLFHQVIEGAEDEYSNYSIKLRKTAGPTVAEVARPWIELAQECFTKFRWMVRKAKPKGRSYNYESLVQIAKHMIKTGSTKEQVHQVIQMFEEGVNEIFTIPKIDGQRVGGGIVPNVELPNGLDPTAVTFQGIIDWAVEKIKGDLGINDIREAYSPKTNDVYKLQQATLESSRNATSYIGTMTDLLMVDTAKHVLLTTQDIVQYKSSLAYDYLQNLVGYGPIQSMSQLENIALHRYGIFVNSYSTYLERQKALQDTSDAYRNKEITYDVYLLINAIDDYRKASYILAYEKQRAKKEKDKEIAQAQENQMALIDRQHAGKMEEINAEGTWAWKREDRRGWWFYMANKDDNTAKLQSADMRAEQRRSELVDKTDANIREDAAKNDLSQRSALPI